MEFRKDINGLRAVAVAVVVLFHMKVAPFAGGFVGVDVFFVISGFLMTSIARSGAVSGSFSIGHFLVKRLRRIFPALAVATLACTVWAGYSYLPGDYKHLMRIVMSALTFRSNLAFSGDVGYFQPDAQKSLVLHTWSLSVEAQFYLAFALFCRVILPREKPDSTLRMTVAFASVLVASLVWCIYETSVKQDAAFYGLASRAWEFSLGALVALHGHRFTATKTSLVSLCGGVLLAIGIFGLDSSHAYPGWRPLLPTIGTALIILSRSGPCTWLLNQQPVQFLGRISYSVYLWHWPLLLAYEERFGSAPDVFATVALLGGSLLFGWLSYVYVEQWTRKTLSDRNMALGTVAVVLGGFAFSTVLSVTDGWPQRLPEYLQPAVQAMNNPNPRAYECSREVDGKKNSPGEFCSIGAATGGAPTMILWGDSFADRLQPAVSEIASSLGISGVVATEGGCPPFKDKVFPGSGAEVFPGCEKYSNFAFDYFQRNPTISVAVIAGDWQRYETQHEGRILLDIAKILASRGGYMVLVSMVPNPRSDIPHEWARRQFRAGKAIPDLSVPLSDEQDLIARGAQLAAIASEAGNVLVVDPFKKMCSASACYTVKDDAAWYSDTDHLSGVGVSQFSPDLSSAVRQAVLKQRSRSTVMSASGLRHG